MIVFFSLGIVHTNWKGGSSQAIWRETYHRNVEAFQAYSLNILWTCTKQIHKTANIFHHQYFTLLQDISGYYFISANQSKYHSYHHIGSYWHVHLSTSYYRFMVPLLSIPHLHLTDSNVSGFFRIYLCIPNRFSSSPRQLLHLSGGAARLTSTSPLQPLGPRPGDDERDPIAGKIRI